MMWNSPVLGRDICIPHTMKIHIGEVTIEANRDPVPPSFHILCMEGLMDVAEEVDKEHESLDLINRIVVRIINPEGL
jgi:hypothetical protein